MSETLKPCPLCGSEPEVRGWASYDGEGTKTIRCRNPECWIETRQFKTLDEAAAAWNRRHASPAARHIAEKIRNATRAGATVDVFGRKRLTGVVLDLEVAEEFAREIGDGAKD